MQKFILFILIIVTGFCSCQKASTIPNTNPPPPTPTDTTKPEPIDTSYLLKTEKFYTYGSAGPINDSGITAWTYDNKARLTSRTYADPMLDIYDTTVYTYSAGQHTEKTVQYRNEQWFYASTQLYYEGSSGRPDSAFSTDEFTGVPTAHSVIYHYYDTEGKDTLNLGYDINKSPKKLFHKVLFFYTGSNLDSNMVYADSSDMNTTSYIATFNNGNMLTENISPYTTPKIYRSFSYTNILSGGFTNINGGNRQLWESITTTYTPGNPISTNVQTYTYTFDANNRVQTVTIMLNNLLMQKKEYTYY